MMIVDAHLDLAYNALRGRDVLRAAREQKADEEGIPSVGLPDLRRGGVGLICGTIFCEPKTWKDRGRGYTTAEEAHTLALEQVEWYEQRVAEGEIALVKHRGDLPKNSTGEAIKMIMLLEGADAIRGVEDVRAFHARGLRMVGMAWKRTRYAGGTGEPGPLTKEGVDLVRVMDELGIVHDVSHLAEESFWQLLEVTGRAVVASHSNCRAIVGEDPGQRQLSDEMIGAIAKRGGVIGINFFDKFLLPAGEYKKRRARLSDVVAHVRRICDIAGSANHVAIGTDMDGGFGREQIPEEIGDAGDLPRVGEGLAEAGFGDGDVAKVLGENWRSFFGEHLPA